MLAFVEFVLAKGIELLIDLPSVLYTIESAAQEPSFRDPSPTQIGQEQSNFLTRNYYYMSFMP